MKSFDDREKTPEKRQALAELMRAGRDVHAAIDAVDIAIAEALGVHRNDLRCLNLLEHGPLAASEIARRTGLSSGAVTALVDRLERAGFVKRQRSETDRRSVYIRIADEAHPKIADLYRTVGSAVIANFDEAEPEEIKAAAGALAKFAAAYNEARTAEITNETSEDIP